MDENLEILKEDLDINDVKLVINRLVIYSFRWKTFCYRGRKSKLC